MGELADLVFRAEVKNCFGYDPGSMYVEKLNPLQCEKCLKVFKLPISLKHHIKDVHEKSRLNKQRKRLERSKLAEVKHAQ